VSVDACAALVARADPDRWAAVLAAPLAARAPLIVLYAYNIEIARAPWVSSQSLICEMRLQWWRDVLVAPARPAHEVAGPLYDLAQQGRVDVALLDAMVAARVWDVYSDPFESADHFQTYLSQTAGGLMGATAQALGARGADALAAAQAYGTAAGLAAYLRAVPELAARGRRPLLDEGDLAIAALARSALDAWTAARAQRRALGQAWPALLAGVQAGAILRRAARAPHLVRAGALHLAPMQARARLIWAAMTGRV
jgi:15-cis-phytoene synthase